MPLLLADIEDYRQEKNSLIANGLVSGDGKRWFMPSTRKLQGTGKVRQLYIGQWMARLGIKAAEVARGAGVSEAYLSELISGKKNRPSYGLVADIAEVLGIPEDYLRRPPPTKETVQSLGEFRADVIDRLRRP